MKNEIYIDSENPYQVVVLLIEIEFEIESRTVNPYGILLCCSMKNEIWIDSENHYQVVVLLI